MLPVRRDVLPRQGEGVCRGAAAGACLVDQGRRGAEVLARIASAGLHCAIVTAAVEDRSADVVWGNGESIASGLAALGEKRTFAAWLGGAR